MPKYSFIPQMSPFNWTILLFIYFSFLILIINKISFFKMYKLSNHNKQQPSTNKFIWMW